jgi:outer membrane receptor protein involved in Fe transport
MFEAIANPAATYGISYNNAGSGRAYGLEVLLRYKPDEHFFGWIAYTLSRSEVKPSPGDPWQLFDYDQTHILTILASYKLPKDWQIGLRFRYVTGDPYTPLVGSYADFDSGSYTPISAYPTNRARLPSFNQLDLRVDKTWTFKVFKLTTYLDLQNVYNQQNPEAAYYNYIYSKMGIVAGLPILPILGVKAEF